MVLDERSPSDISALLIYSSLPFHCLFVCGAIFHGHFHAVSFTGKGMAVVGAEERDAFSGGKKPQWVGGDAGCLMGHEPANFREFATGYCFSVHPQVMLPALT